MYGKIFVNEKIEVLTGMHIGGSTAFSAIGSVDAPVICDARTGQPIIPGSSLKGKLRTLLARSISNSIIPNKGPDEDEIIVKRLFGGDKGKIKSRFQFIDSFITNEEELKDVGFTEIKFENTIKRLTGVANPRQIERVIRGAKFGFSVVYDIVSKDETEEDVKNFAKALKLLQMDYLGGHGTRGYGRVRFNNFSVKGIDGSLSSEDEEKLCLLLKEVEKNELLSVPAKV